MSLFGRALAGAARAGEQVANTYMDHAVAQQRAQALADLQVATAAKVREQDDAFRNDPTRVERDRKNKRDDVLAAGATAREVELAALTDPALRGAKRTVGDEDAADTLRRDKTRVEAMTPLEVERARAIADIQARTQAKYREGRADPAAEIAKKVAGIEAVLGRKLTEPEKLAALGMAGKSAGDEQYETVTETTGGGVTGEPEVKRVFKQPRGKAGDPTSDPIKAALDAARAARTPKPAAPAAASPTTAPAASGEPGLLSRALEKASSVASTVGEMGRDYTSPEGKRMLADLVAQAKAGTRPLTKIETMRAQQAGLL